MYDVLEELCVNRSLVLSQLDAVLAILEGPDGANAPVATLVITDGGAPESWARRALLTRQDSLDNSEQSPKHLLWEMRCCAHAYNLLTGGIVDALWRSLMD
eukprot:3802886-Rhodomonas_salina.1